MQPMSKPQTKAQFLKLQAAWYAKADKAGFKDIESPDGKYLKQWDSHWFKARYTPQQFKDKQNYWQMCRDFLHQYKFKSERDRRIWELYTDGHGCVYISKNAGTPKATVIWILRKLKSNLMWSAK